MSGVAACNRLFKTLCLSASLLLCALPAQAELQLFFVHNDHLNTPKYLTDTTGKAVWQAQATPFGDVTENGDLDGDGKYVTLNMRFPGQYWDPETGTSYNYFRDYDPSLGRYVQSDPIGLGGGINTFGYVEGNPLTGIDPFGLYKLRPGVPAPTPEVHEVLVCVDTCTGGQVVVTATTNGHTRGAHVEGKGADFLPPNGCSPDRGAQCALECHAVFVQNEYTCPSPRSTGGHIHMQTRPGLGGATGNWCRR